MTDASKPPRTPHAADRSAPVDYAVATVRAPAHNDEQYALAAAASLDHHRARAHFPFALRRA
ncbi:MAG TPA: hypothetical protein VN880_00615, partial [Solirubrobacteraceae bacterium]|nr:hypothetical protein [Solirubrobacteraceae bacterium]